MSELINIRSDHATIREQLMVTASALALSTYLLGVPAARADDADRPTVWIELGGQAEFISGVSSPFTAPFMSDYATSPAFSPISPVEAQKPSRFSLGEEGKISIQPKDTNWTFSASLRYGRSNSSRTVHQQTHVGHPVPTSSYFYQYFAGIGVYETKVPGVPYYVDEKAQHSESHLVLDFQAGKDVGLGLFGADSTSTFSAGIRMARFSSRSSVDIKARPQVYVSFGYLPKYHFHKFNLSGSSARSFQGIGPTVSWSGSKPLLGNPSDGEIDLDWGINAAVLFGRQKAGVHHNTTGRYSGKYGTTTLYQRSPADQNRAHSVVVPNIGGNAGITYRFDSAKLNIGYRADMFFNAMDTGIDARRETNVLFHGPYATLSIGLGG